MQKLTLFWLVSYYLMSNSFSRYDPEMDGRIILGKVDCTEQADLCRRSFLHQFFPDLYWIWISLTMDVVVYLDCQIYRYYAFSLACYLFIKSKCLFDLWFIYCHHSRYVGRIVYKCSLSFFILLVYNVFMFLLPSLTYWAIIGSLILCCHLYLLLLFWFLLGSIFLTFLIDIWLTSHIGSAVLVCCRLILVEFC